MLQGFIRKLKQARAARWNPTGTALVHPVTGEDILPFDVDGNLVATVVHNTDTLAELLTLPGTLGEISVATDCNAVVVHNGVAGGARVSSSTVLHAFPNTPQVYTSPVAGDPDTANKYSLAELAQHLVTGFMLPKAGIITDIGIIGQGNSGTGTLRTIRWTVASVRGDNTAVTGVALDQILDTATTTVADNVNGNVVLATGKTIAVPAQFVVCLKAGLGATYNVQLMNSAGPVPGVIGSIGNGVLISASTYSTTTIDLAATPAALLPGEKISVLAIKGVAVYIKWKGQ